MKLCRPPFEPEAAANGSIGQLAALLAAYGERDARGWLVGIDEASEEMEAAGHPPEIVASAITAYHAVEFAALRNL